MFAIYRATLDDADQNHESAKTKLTMPVLAIGSEYIIDADNERQTRQVAENVTAAILPWRHPLAEECPEDLAKLYIDFFNK